MIILLPGVPLHDVILRLALADFEVRARDDDVGGVGAAAPFLAVEAVAQGCYLGGAGVGVVDCAAEAGAGWHCCGCAGVGVG